MLKKLLTIFMICFSLIACSQKPINPPEATTPAPPAQELTSMPLPLPTSTPLASPIVPPLPTFPFPTALPTFTPVRMEMPPDFSPILYGKKYDANTFFILLGGVGEGDWLEPNLALARFAGAWEYDVYTFAKGRFQVHGYAPEFFPTSQSYSLRTDVTLDEFGMVGVAHGWQVTQRDVEELSPANQFYEQMVIDWLIAKGISEPQLGILRIFRVDIEGDGTDEIFISATHLDESQHTTKAGDYSIILMRKVTGNDVVTLSIVGNVYHSQELEITYPRTYSLANFIDLNQDGVLEVVVDIQRWESFGAIVYQIDGLDIIDPLRE